jgi:DnaJ-class molecular chaperone
MRKITILTWAPCKTCEGSGLVWDRGAHYHTTVVCHACFGLGEIKRPMTKPELEKLAAELQQELAS